MTQLLDWLLIHYGQEQVKADPGLTRIRSALAPILPKLSQIPVITIAGTNGKGETTLWLSHYLKSKRRCVWMSPHIERITERMSSEQGEIELGELEALVKNCHQEVQRLGHKLSFYEFLFFVFCHWVIQRKPEILLLEVGLGGRLDAVNVFDAQMVLLPSISRDHQEYLGSRFDLILQEKLGLLRPGKILLSYLSLRYLREKTLVICEQKGVQWFDLEEWGVLPSFEFSKRNQLLAYAASRVFEGKSLIPLKTSHFYSDWKPEVRHFEHRGEVISHRGEYHFFGSHNVDGMRKLIQFLQSDIYNFKRPTFDAIIAAFSKRDEEDLRVLLKMLKASALGPVYVTTFTHPKAAGEVMKSLVIQEGLQFVDDIAGLIQKLEQTGMQKRILVTGSYYFMGHFKSYLRGR